jgi:hypothetical protein
LRQSARIVGQMRADEIRSKHENALLECKIQPGHGWIWKDIDGYKWIWINLNGYWWLLMYMDTYKWIFMDMNWNGWIWMDINGLERHERIRKDIKK